MRFNEKADKYLEEFYNSVGAKTWEQKLNLLTLKLGPCSFSHNATAEQKVAAMEYELLYNAELIELVLA